MSAVLDRFDRWVATGPFTAVDLGAYRIVYAVLMLLTVRGFSWVSAYPDSLFDPPPGPFMVFGGFPAEGATIALEIVLSIVLVSLALGYLTTAASVVTVLALLAGSRFSFSLGKIDHEIFTLLVPAVLAFARWGDAVSVDAVLRRRRSASIDGPVTQQWPMRFLALLVGLGFFTAAVPKILSGWLDPRTQAVQGVMGRQYYLNGRTELLAPFAVHLDVPALWELMDVSAVLIEVAILLTVPWWRAFRTALACAALFHVGVFLIMNISFAGNVLVYGAFVSWSALAGMRGAQRPATSGRRASMVSTPRWLVHVLAVGAAVMGGTGIWAARQAIDPAGPLRTTVLAVGGAVAVWYLVRQLSAARAAWSAHRAGVAQRRSPATITLPPPDVDLTDPAPRERQRHRS